ncbi:hypothetical protein [Polyangium mundeleinium]|uniref:Uncharacterized protein n=1 Tax=Polyangium mundeleinium TaxID=2995306 RepID=A0ABT5ENY0_9BACT|nr:hypothetical protein [Polyangium mundeleinium]MDC0743539.1 hypothetical protein [Polyangium mundeleinium]
MADKQALLASAVPDLVLGLVNPPCVDDKGETAMQQPGHPLDPCPAGTQRVMRPVLDIHIGVLSSSLGGHGADTCPDLVPDEKTCAGKANTTNNDKGHLVARLDPCGDAAAPTYGDRGFLAWDPAQSLVPAGESDIQALGGSLRDMVAGVGPLGCEYESQLESVYRFLVDPAPYASISVVNNRATPEGEDTALLQQRAAFLPQRPPRVARARGGPQNPPVLGSDTAASASLSSIRSLATCRPSRRPQLQDRAGNLVPNPPLHGPPIRMTLSDNPANLVLFFSPGSSACPGRPSPGLHSPSERACSTAAELAAPIDAPGATPWNVIPGIPRPTCSRSIADDRVRRDSARGRTRSRATSWSPRMRPRTTPDQRARADARRGRPAIRVYLPSAGGQERDCTDENLAACDCKATDTPIPSARTNPASGGAPTLQVRATAYPSLRQLAVLRGLEAQAVVASVCPASIEEASGPVAVIARPFQRSARK